MLYVRDFYVVVNRNNIIEDKICFSDVLFLNMICQLNLGG